MMKPMKPRLCEPSTIASGSRVIWTTGPVDWYFLFTGSIKCWSHLTQSITRRSHLSNPPECRSELSRYYVFSAVPRPPITQLQTPPYAGSTLAQSCMRPCLRAGPTSYNAWPDLNCIVSCHGGNCQTLNWSPSGMCVIFHSGDPLIRIYKHTYWSICNHCIYRIYTILFWNS